MKSLDRYITSALLDESFTRPKVKGDLELLCDRVNALDATLQFQNQRAKALEAEIQRKNQYIAELEMLIKRLESGRVMRLFRRLKQ